MAFRKCGRPAGSGRLPVLSGSQQSEGVGSSSYSSSGLRSGICICLYLYGYGVGLVQHNTPGRERLSSTVGELV